MDLRVLEMEVRDQKWAASETEKGAGKRIMRRSI
jgi:hypothetical protein